MACRKEFPSRASCVELLTTGFEETPLPFGLSSIPLRRYSWFASTRGRGAAIPLASDLDLFAYMGGGRSRLFIPDGVFFVMVLPGGCASDAATVRPGQGMCAADNVIFEEAPTTPLGNMTRGTSHDGVFGAPIFFSLRPRLRPWQCLQKSGPEEGARVFSGEGGRLARLGYKPARFFLGALMHDGVAPFLRLSGLRGSASRPSDAWTLRNQQYRQGSKTGQRFRGKLPARRQKRPLSDVLAIDASNWGKGALSDKTHRLLRGLERFYRDPCENHSAADGLAGARGRPKQPR